MTLESEVENVKDISSFKSNLELIKEEIGDLRLK